MVSGGPRRDPAAPIGVSTPPTPPAAQAEPGAQFPALTAGLAGDHVHAAACKPFPDRPSPVLPPGSQRLVL